MTVVNQILVEVFDVVERAVHLEARNGVGTVTEAGQAAATTATNASASATSTGSSGSSSSSSGGGQSPLLFFVALGFGVVFTNLWIIVGIKYCFRYNARNRALARGENLEEVPLDNVPPGRPHSRRREKKLMTMDEVNERFPMMKYKMWIATRANQGLSTAGGVTAPPGRPDSLRDADGVAPAASLDDKHAGDKPATPSLSEDAADIAPIPTTGIERGSMDSAKSASVSHKEIASTADYESQTDDKNTMPTLQEVPTIATVDDPKADQANDVDSDDDDDHIHDALPVEMLDSPGDSCAICIDTLEQDDDIRGLTCGHVFHAGCLDPWLTSRRACCPLCKADYYIPKPKPEGEAAATAAEGRERSGRRAARTGAAAPPQAYGGWRGLRGHGRHVLSGFIPNSTTSNGGDGYAQRSRRSRASERYRREAAQARAAMDQGQPVAEVPSLPISHPFSGLRMPRFGLPSRRQDNVARRTQERTQQNQVTPSQLEQGTVR